MDVPPLLVPVVGRLSQTAPWRSRMGRMICATWHCVVGMMTVSESDLGWPLLLFHGEKREQLKALSTNVGSRIF